MSSPDPVPPLAGTIAVGAVAGLLAGLFGVGGGLVLVPGMVLFLGVAQHRAHASSLAAIVVTAPAALIGFALAGEVAVVPSVLIAAGAVAGAVAGADVMKRLSDARLRQGFAVLLVLVAGRLVFGALTGADAETTPPDLDALTGFAYVGLGLASGLLAALMGVGGGLILVPAMVVVFAFPQHLAEGTSLAVIIPTALVAAWRHTRSGYTDWGLGMRLGAASVVGALLGAQVALALEAEILQALFAFFLLATAVRMLIGNRRQPDIPPEA